METSSHHVRADSVTAENKNSSADYSPLNVPVQILCEVHMRSDPSIIFQANQFGNLIYHNSCEHGSRKEKALPGWQP
jgi:hypothetical protein